MPTAEPPGLPQSFTPILDIHEEKVSVGSFVNIIGLVKDFRLPVPTNGRLKDYKATMTLCDLSTQDQSGVDFVIFRPEKEIPVVGAADVVLLFSARVQRFKSDPLSLITHFSTCIMVYSASRIPRPPSSARQALLPVVRVSDRRQPTDKVHAYVAHMFHAIDKDAIPDEEEFKAKTVMSMNVKEKFSLLKDIEEGKFYDFIVQVARNPFDMGDRVTLYVSDYTQNGKFFNYTWEGVQDLDVQSDVWGYTNKNKENDDDSGQKEKWAGPYGRKAMQITVYDSHASHAKSELHAGDWISIRNVFVNYGRNGMHLEGYVREARNLAVSTNYISLLDPLDRDGMDPKLKDAIRRHYDYTKEKKADIKRLKAAEGGGKRKRDSDSDEPSNPKKSGKLNARERRDLQRQAVDKRVAEEEAEARVQEAKALEALDLNTSVVCEHQDKPVTPVSAIVEPRTYDTLLDGEPATITLPFVCSNYRANVRVVDFRPSRLEDFASSRRRTAFDVLSDNSGSDSSSDSDDTTNNNNNHRGSGQEVWEWRFALQLEDASPPKQNNKNQSQHRQQQQQPSRVWVLVDNAAAQCLTGLDAADLRVDRDTLTTLREKMFYLWGELEEHKGGLLALRTRTRTTRARPGAAPPPTLSDDEGGNEGGKAVDVSNKPFTCCIRQYGVTVPEREGDKADAGRGKRWQRVFGLFGTKIAG